MMNDLVSDMIVRIKMAYMRRYNEVYIKKSKFIKGIIICLLENNCIRGYIELDYEILVFLKYRGDYGYLSGMKKISKISRRVFIKNNKKKKNF